MGISSKYIAYLEAFGSTLPLGEFAARPHAPGIALRHDVDYDLDIALELAFWEQRHAIRSTYFILHTAAYIDDRRHIEKMLQLQDFGHEVGLHNNFLTEWVVGNSRNLNEDIAKLLTEWRNSGLIVEGVAAHGDRACYQHGYINYWMFSELRPPHPKAAEDGKSAEGIRVPNAAREIAYPDNDILTTHDDRVLSLWGTSMSALGLQYEAVFVPSEQYYSDSGGSWIGGADPLKKKFKNSRIQVSMHPIYWQAPRKTYFFLSTARSGSKWLATVLETASSVHARHEFMLNHDIVEGSLRETHRTGEGFAQLSQNQNAAFEIFSGLQDWVQAVPRDYAEVNVYLPFFLEALCRAFPHAEMVFLHRNPAHVYRSLINRNWYDTPHDERHGVVPAEGWEDLSQFDKCAIYIAWTMELLFRRCKFTLCLEKISTNKVEFSNGLAVLGIAFYPRLAGDLFEQRINANTESEFPEFEHWPIAASEALTRKCDAISCLLGYPAIHPARRSIESTSRRLLSRDLSVYRQLRPRRRVRLVSNLEKIPRKAVGGFCELHGQAIEFRPNREGHTYLVLGSTSWRKAAPTSWAVDGGITIAGTVSIVGDFVPESFVRIMLLGYTDGMLSDTRTLRTIRENSYGVRFACRTKFRVDQIALAFFMPKNCHPRYVRIDAFEISAGDSLNKDS